MTNARVCIEIPFRDGSEGACVWTVSREQELIDTAAWAEQRPYMLMIDAKSWTEIKKDWLKACRGTKSCNVQVQSVDEVVQALDKILGAVLRSPK